MEISTKGRLSTSPLRIVLRTCSNDERRVLRDMGKEDENLPVTAQPNSQPDLTNYLIDAVTNYGTVSKNKAVWVWLGSTPSQVQRRGSSAEDSSREVAPDDHAHGSISRCASTDSKAYKEIDHMEGVRYEYSASYAGSAEDCISTGMQGPWCIAMSQLELDENYSIGYSPFSTVYTCRLKNETGLACKVIKDENASSHVSIFSCAPPLPP